MDNSKEIIKLMLEKYWAGESTLEHEAQLSAYFTSQNVEEELKVYIPLFSFFNEEKKQSIHLEDKIMAKIESSTVTTSANTTKVIRLNWQRAVAIAASLLLVITIGFNTYRSQQQIKVAQLDTFESPEQALAQTKAALLYLSSRMNKGANKATLSISKTKSLDIIN